jgi:Tfp pilus assembly protein PilX
MAAADEARQVALDLKKKLRLEAQFRPDVVAMFNGMLQAHMRSVAKTGLPLNAAEWVNTWTAMLESHYASVQDDFRGVVAQMQKAVYGIETKQDEDDLDEEAIAAALLLWRSGQAPTQARHITDTNIRNVSEAMQNAQAALLEQGEDINNLNMSRASGAILKRSFDGRTTNIVMTETQAAAEGRCDVRRITTRSGYWYDCNSDRDKEVGNGGR